MRVLFLFLILTCGFCLSGCRKSNIRDNEIVRRMRLRNTPDALSKDFTSALASGDVDRLCALSTDRVRDTLHNELLLMYPDQPLEESLEAYSAELKERNKEKTFSGIILKDSATGKIAVCSVLEKGRNLSTFSFRIVQDEHGNWKNDTRL